MTEPEPRRVVSRFGDTRPDDEVVECADSIAADLWDAEIWGTLYRRRNS